MTGEGAAELDELSAMRAELLDLGAASRRYAVQDDARIAAGKLIAMRKQTSSSLKSKIAECQRREISWVVALIPARQNRTLDGGFREIEFWSESRIPNTQTGS
jgi:hypothetical protein